MDLLQMLLIVAIGVLNIVCFVVGAKVGQKVVKGETVTLPNINPIQAMQDHREKKQIQKEQETFDIIMENIERYDGTGEGQKDVGR